jgi:osmotically inducible protein OsmC
MKRTASADWSGDRKSRHGRMSIGSAVPKDMKYSFTDRFESISGTDPEELIAAATPGARSPGW